MDDTGTEEDLVEEQHCHKNKTNPDIDKKARRKLIIASVLSFSFMVAEIVGGIFAHSLAIVSDGAHLLTDLASFLISLVSLYLASRQATKKLSFGWYRSEILGALCSVILLWVVTSALCYIAIQRVIKRDYEINATIMLITASCGVAFNLVLGLSLHPGGSHGHSHSHGINDNNGNHRASLEKENNEIRHLRAKNTKPDTCSSYGSLKNGKAQSTDHESRQNGCCDKVQVVTEDGPEQPVTESVATLFNGTVDGKYEPLEQSLIQNENAFGVRCCCFKTACRYVKQQIGDIWRTLSKGHFKGANINVTASFIHVLGDLLQSIGVLIAALIIYFKPEWKLADPICTFLFSIIVLFTTMNVMRDIVVVLMEGTPKSIDFRALHTSLKSIREVKDIHDLRIWSLSMEKLALSVHIAVDKSCDAFAVLRQASSAIKDQFKITETTIQIEEHVPDMLDCTHCMDLPD